ncbi:MAG: GAF domain-containing protein [Polyangiaceae bacterium]|nr:GAF domain-containing protein [Polyangiaceae bacterium]
MAGHPIEKQLARLELLHRIGLALSSEKNRGRLLETIVVEAKNACHADGGTLYLRTPDNHLRFAIMINDSLGIRLGGTTGIPIDLPPIPMCDPVTGCPNECNVASYAASLKRSVNVADAYDTQSFDFSGTKRFDTHHSYRSESFLTIPMVSYEDRVIGVFQLINALDETGKVVPFSLEDQSFAESLASQAGIALDNQALLDEQRVLMESFIKVLAAATDAKSPYTGGHCERVPILAEMLVQAACDDTSEAFSAFSLSDDERYEFRIAAWLHDCGKVVTPSHVMDKMTKLEAVTDRIQAVRDRFEILRRDVELDGWRRYRGGEVTLEGMADFVGARFAELDEDLSFLLQVNIGSESLDDLDVHRIHRIAGRRFRRGTEDVPLLSCDEVTNLSVRRGTLSEAERLVINGHVVETIKMLESLPFPRNLSRVPEYAGAHHERMDAKGYPRGIHAGDASIPARIMVVADVFEALTAKDRPYKVGKRLSEAMEIMGQMKLHNHLDPDIFNLFVRSGTYLSYAHRYLSKEQLDRVDEAQLLAIKPLPFQWLSDEEREMRKESILPDYGKPRDGSFHPPPMSISDWVPPSYKSKLDLESFDEEQS